MHPLLCLMLLLTTMGLFGAAVMLAVCALSDWRPRLRYAGGALACALAAPVAAALYLTVSVTGAGAAPFSAHLALSLRCFAVIDAGLVIPVSLGYAFDTWQAWQRQRATGGV